MMWKYITKVPLTKSKNVATIAIHESPQVDSRMTNKEGLGETEIVKADFNREVENCVSVWS